MCGVVGYWGDNANESLGLKMAARLKSRGPDSYGVHVESSSSLVLAHRRLSILDLSLAGSQPMESACGHYWLAFNGEIYNHLDLRLDIESFCGGHKWLGGSDTETLLVALTKWGIKETLERLNGMFAFALWNSQEQKLYLARDRMGEKPFYYGVNSGIFFYGSQLNAFYAHPKWTHAINKRVLTSYLRLGYVPSPDSIFEGIKKLPAASYLVVSNKAKKIGDPIPYWSLTSCVHNGLKNAYKYSNISDAVSELDSRLAKSVKSRMIADVPLGAFLSGGYDSTAVVAQMVRVSTNAVNTFTIGLESSEFDEAKQARKVSAHLETNHTEMYVSNNDVLRVIPKLGSMFDEPFADASQIPTFLVAELAKKSVTVSLSGDGGDELFYGYNRHAFAERYWPLLKKWPISIRRFFALLFSRLTEKKIEQVLAIINKLGNLKLSHEQWQKIILSLTKVSESHLYDSLLSGVSSNSIEPLLLNPIFCDRVPIADIPEGISAIGKFAFLDTKSYLCDDVLTKVDRATMAVSLEARVPMLDHELVAFAWSLPDSLKFKSGQGKWILRELVHRFVPENIMAKPKMGFGVPLGEWLRGPLATWAEEMLSFDLIGSKELLNHSVVRGIWNEHQMREKDHTKLLWNILMLQVWLMSLD